MKDLKLVLRDDITDIDILNNICEDTTAILVDEDNCWIEISDKGFFVPDGWMGVTTKDIVHQTVPSSSHRDPALVKLDEDRLKTAPPNPEVLARMRALLGRQA